MNGVIRNSLKLPNSNLLGLLSRDVRNKFGSSRFFNTLTKTNNCWTSVNTTAASIVPRISCVKNYSSESNDVAVELTKFLEQEIDSEKEMLGSKTIPSKIDDFQVKLDGAEVTLTKSCPKETIKITFSINDSVHADEEEEFDDTTQAANEPPELKSKPDFDIDITRGDTTLGFTCQYVQGDLESVEDQDVFTINEVTLYQGEYTEKVYGVAGQILDGYLYDLLMNLLDSKGITNEFVIKMSDLSTAYEQSSYISLLRAMKDFTSK